jgi:hypothetical protein
MVGNYIRDEDAMLSWIAQQPARPIYDTTGDSVPHEHLIALQESSRALLVLHPSPTQRCTSEDGLDCLREVVGMETHRRKGMGVDEPRISREGISRAQSFGDRVMATALIDRLAVDNGASPAVVDTSRYAGSISARIVAWYTRTSSWEPASGQGNRPPRLPIEHPQILQESTDRAVARGGGIGSRH